MKAARTLAVVFSLLTLVFATSAEARRGTQPVRGKSTVAKKDGRWARPKVVKYHQVRGRSTNLRVHKVRSSRSGKSAQVVVSNKNSGKVTTYNVHKTTGKVSATRTGLTKQSTARGKASRNLRRENAPKKGTFSGVNSSGLSKSGRSMKFTSKTDRNEKGYVKLVGGGLLRSDNGKRAKTTTTKAPKRAPKAPAKAQGAVQAAE